MSDTDKQNVLGDQARQIAGYRVDYAYAQLLVASITLKHALDSDSSYQPYALAKYQTSALSLLHTFRDSLSVLDYANCALVSLRLLSDLPQSFCLRLPARLHGFPILLRYLRGSVSTSSPFSPFFKSFPVN